MANKVITVTDPSVVTNDTLLGYNNYSDQDGQLGTTMTPTEATNGKTITLSDGVVHEVTTKPVGTTNGEFSAVVSNAVQVDLSDSYLLDTYPSAAVAYSLQQLKTGITDVVLLRRSSDDAELGFTETEILDGTLTTWTGSGSAYVKTWYDQSGNNNHATELEDASQPRLVNAGVIELTNAKPAINFLFQNPINRLQANRVLSTPTYSIHYVCEIENLVSSSTDGNQAIISQTTGAADVGRTNLVQQVDTTVNNVGFFNNGASQPLLATQAWTTGQKFNQRYQIAGDHKVLIQPSSTFETVVTGQANTPMDGSFNIGFDYNIDTTSIKNGFEGKIQEIIVWESDQEANRVAIDTEIKSRY